MNSTTVLEAIYEEVKSISKRLDMLEDLIEEIIIKDLRRVKLSDEEINEIKKSIKDMKRGEYATLEDLKRV